MSIFAIWIVFAFSDHGQRNELPDSLQGRIEFIDAAVALRVDGVSLDMVTALAAFSSCVSAHWPDYVIEVESYLDFESQRLFVHAFTIRKKRNGEVFIPWSGPPR